MCICLCLESTRLIREQNRAFEMAEQIDRVRAESIKAEEERRQRVAEQERMEEEMELERLRNLEIPEDAAGDHVIAVRIVLPCGTRYIKKYNESDKLQLIRNFVDTRVLPENGEYDVPKGAPLVIDRPERVVFTDEDMDKSLAELGIATRSIVYVHNV